MKKILAVFSIIAIALVVASGCGGGGGGGGSTTPPPSNSNVKSIQLAPATATLPIGGTLVVTTLGLDSNGAGVTVPPTNWSWVSSNSAVATVTATGDRVTLTGVSAGTTTITVTESSSGMKATATVTVNGPGGSSGGTATTTTTGATTTTTGATTTTGVTSTTGPTTTAGPTSTTGPTTTTGANITCTPGTVFYSNDFKTGKTDGWSSATLSATPIGARPFLGELGAGIVTLTLTGIPAHSMLNVSFDLFIIRSMDGNNPNPGLGPDVWALGVDTTTVLATTFANVSAPPGTPTSDSFDFYQAYPDWYPGGSHPYQSGASESNTLGYQFKGLPEDSVYHICADDVHSSPNATIVFNSKQNQDIFDESWGITNVVVSYR